MATIQIIRAQRMMATRPLHRQISNLSQNRGNYGQRSSSILKSSLSSCRVSVAAAFSTQAKSSDNFLSGQSSLYAESMLEMYENDPNSVPEVRCNINYLPDVCVFITYTYPYQIYIKPPTHVSFIYNL